MKNGYRTVPEKEFIQSLRDFRIWSGLTQAEVAKRLGTCQSWVGRFETGPHSPTLDSILRYAEVVYAKVGVEAGVDP